MDQIQLEIAKSVEEIQKFPLRRMYFVVIFILTLLSPIGLTLQTDDANSLPWEISASFQISSITILFLILAWLPLLFPWLVSISPRLQNFFIGLRESGLEEIEAGILRIKLSSGIKEAAEIYQNKVVKPNQPEKASLQTPQQIEASYQDALAAIKDTATLSSLDALSKINDLSQYYDQIRSTLPSGPRRTQLLEELSFILWTLMPNVNNFPVRDRLKSSKGGERLSAYKYLEYQPSLQHLDLLISRAIGVLEEPFGQYSALLALRRAIAKLHINDAQKALIIDKLMWASQIEYMGRDRSYVMRSIMSSLNIGAKG